MPQATSELQAAWPGGDTQALDHLAPNFVTYSGFIKQRDDDYQLTERDLSAINYLIQEWDYMW